MPETWYTADKGDEVEQHTRDVYQIFATDGMLEAVKHLAVPVEESFDGHGKFRDGHAQSAGNSEAQVFTGQEHTSILRIPIPLSPYIPTAYTWLMGGTGRSTSV